MGWNHQLEEGFFLRLNFDEILLCAIGESTNEAWDVHVLFSDPKSSAFLEPFRILKNTG